MRRGIPACVLTGLLGCLCFLLARGASGPGSRAVADEPPPAGPPRDGYPRVVLETDLGDLLVDLYPAAAPRTVEQFLDLVDEGIYDGTRISRIVPGFLAQVADVADRDAPLTEEQKARLLPLPHEPSGIIHRRGVLSMAREIDPPAPAGTSFVILLGPASHMDGKYAAFGEVVDGFGVLDALALVPLDGEVPLKPLRLRRARRIPPGAEDIVLRRASAPPSKTPEPGTWPLALLGTLALVGGAVHLVAAGRGHRRAASLGLIGVLGAFFGLLVHLGPEAPRHRWLALALFGGMLGVLKLMNRFESSAK